MRYIFPVEIHNILSMPTKRIDYVAGDNIKNKAKCAFNDEGYMHVSRTRKLTVTGKTRIEDFLSFITNIKAASPVFMVFEDEYHIIKIRCNNEHVIIPIDLFYYSGKYDCLYFESEGKSDGPVEIEYTEYELGTASTLVHNSHSTIHDDVIIDFGVFKFEKHFRMFKYANGGIYNKCIPVKPAPSSPSPKKSVIPWLCN